MHGITCIQWIFGVYLSWCSEYFFCILICIFIRAPRLVENFFCIPIYIFTGVPRLVGRVLSCSRWHWWLQIVYCGDFCKTSGGQKQQGWWCTCTTFNSNCCYHKSIKSSRVGDNSLPHPHSTKTPESLKPTIPSNCKSNPFLTSFRYKQE